METLFPLQHTNVLILQNNYFTLVMCSLPFLIVIRLSQYVCSTRLLNVELAGNGSNGFAYMNESVEESEKKPWAQK